MSGYDDSKCFLIETKLADIINKEKDDTELTCKDGAYMIAFLENTQVIYEGVERLLEGMSCCEDATETCKRVKSAMRGVIDLEEEHESVGDEYIKTNMNRYFFQFMDMRKCYTDRCNSHLQYKYANMCCYMQKIKELSTRKDTVDDPYDYEKICNYIRDIMGYELCMLLYTDVKVHQLALSSVESEYVRKGLSMSKISEIINQFKENACNEHMHAIYKTVQLYEDCNNKYLVIHVPIYQNSIYVLLCSKISGVESIETRHLAILQPLDYETLWNVRNVLFLSYQLKMILARDMIALKTMFRRYDYVEAINKNVCRILHISDLHVSKQKKCDLLQKIENWDNQECNKCDLLLITGDVIDGSYNATGLTDNYNAAIEVIKEIIIKIWGIKNGRGTYVRSDWKKRIVISAGNHDYASMNELEALNQHRTTLSGKISDSKGDTMIKYSYFIIFLHRLLGTDIDDILVHDLNETIRYDRLHTTVVNINTSSGANPYRTNKVQIDNKAVAQVLMEKEHDDKMASGSGGQHNVIYMMHHTPLYKIDYLADSYRLSNDLLSAAQTILENESITLDAHKVWINLVAGVVNQLEEIGIPGECEKLEDAKGLMKKMLDEFFKVDKALYEEIGLFDLQYAMGVESDVICTDDRHHKILSKLKEKIELSDIDQKKYIDVTKNLFDKERNNFLIIGGHTHRTAKFNDRFCGVLENCKGVIEIAKFFTSQQLGTDFCYNLIEFEYNNLENINCKVNPENQITDIDGASFPISEILKSK